MKELLSLEQGRKCAANQVLYSLQNREIEFDLLLWSHTNKIPIMAYSPVGHGGALLRNSVLKKIGTARDATPAQIALAWVLRQPEVIAIPKASNQFTSVTTPALLNQIDERTSGRSRPRISSTEIKDTVAGALTSLLREAK